MEKKETSIYHVKGSFIEKKENLNVKPWTEDMEKGMGGYGLSILKVLTRFLVLNKACILKSLQSVNPSKWKEDMLSKTLKALRKAEMIQMFQMNGNAEGESLLVVYCISEKGEQYLDSIHISNSEGIKGRELIYDTYNCARRLALNQWHINMLNILGNRVKNAYFKSFKMKNTTVPSVITYKPYSAKLNGKKHLTLFAFAAPKDNESIEIFANYLVNAYEFLSDPKNNGFRPGIVIILCENMNHTAWVSWKFNQFRQLRPFNSLLYAIDITTNKERVLSLLNECEANEIGITRSGINLE